MARGVPRQVEERQRPAAEVHGGAVLERIDLLVPAQVEGVAKLLPEDLGVVGPHPEAREQLLGGADPADLGGVRQDRQVREQVQP